MVRLAEHQRFMFWRRAKKLEKKIDKLEDAKTDITWGSQIRSCVLHPYRMIKDMRTRLETGDTERILDGGRTTSSRPL